MRARKVDPTRVEAGPAEDKRAGTGRARALGRFARGALSVMVASLLPGCFTFIPVDPRAVPADEDVRIIIDEQASARVQEFGLAGDRLMGRLTLITADSVYVAAWVGDAYAGTQFSTARQTVPLRRTDVIEVQRRRLSKPRTALAIGAAVGVVAILVSRLAQSDNPNDDEPEPPPPPPIPAVIRIRF